MVNVCPVIGIKAGKYMRKLRLKQIKRDELGFSLIETVIALALIAILSAGFLTSMSTASKSLIHTDLQETAKNIAESQLETIKKGSFALTYNAAPLAAAYSGYSVSIAVASVPSAPVTLQKITITVSYQGQQVTQIEGYKRQ